MNKKILWIPAALIFIGIILLANKGCQHQEDGNNFSAKVVKTDYTGQDNIKNFELFIDFSGSMRGFVDYSNIGDSYNANSNMKSTITAFLDNIEASYNIKTRNHCTGKTYDKDSFSKRLQDQSLFSGGTTLLHDMISEACTKANDSTVVAIVSDMVLSFGRQKLLSSNDRYYNKNHLDDLVSVIHATMVKNRQSGIHVILSQYYSDYNGNYYCNYTENLEDGSAYKGKLMKHRPFYILLVGKEEALKGIFANKCLRDAENVYSSFGINANDWANVPFEIKQDKETEFWTVGSDPNRNGTFWTSANWDSYKTIFYIDCPNFKIPSFLNKKDLKANCLNGAVSNISYDDLHGRLSYILETKPFKELAKETEVEVNIISTNNWKSSATILDDVNKDLDTLESRTWGLSSLIQVFDDVYRNKASYEGDVVGKFSFILVKK